MSETPTKLRPYKLPTLDLLWTGAVEGMVGGAWAGVISTTVLVVLYLLLSALAGGFSFNGQGGFWNAAALIAWWPLLGCGGAMVGTVLGAFIGVGSFFVLAPWIPTELWPELGQPLKRGILFGSLCAIVLGLVLQAMTLSSVMAFLPLALSTYVSTALEYYWVVCLLGPVCGGFINPLRLVVLPYLLAQDSQE